MTDAELLARIDERTQHLAIELGELREDVAGIVARLDRQLVPRAEIERRFAAAVSREAFGPVRMLVFGFAGLVLASVAGALIAQVL